MDSLGSLPAQVRASLDFGEVQLEAKMHQRYYDLGWWRKSTVIDDFYNSWQFDPEKTALVTNRIEDGVVESKTYAEYAALVERVAGGLVELGVQPGEVVSVQLPNWWQFNVMLLATFKVGAALNPIIPAHRRRDVAFMIQLLGSRILVVPTIHRRFNYLEMATQISEEVQSLEHIVAVDDGEISGVLSFERFFLGQPWEEKHRSELASRKTYSDQLAELMFTSGTTGEPKGVAHTHNTQFARARAIFDNLALTRDDVVFAPSTVAHSTGLVYGCITPAMLGMKAVYQDVWNADSALDVIEREGVTWSFVTTTFVVDMIRAQRQRPRDLSSLRFLVCGGAAIPPAVAIEAKEVLSTRLMAVWGMTENGAVTCTHPDDPYLEAAESDGKACPWMQMKIVDEETDEEVPPGTVGELKVKGASQMLGYLKRPELTSAAYDLEGWFSTGDLARIDPEGHLRLTGRLKDIIVRGGENIPVAEVEAVLYKHPSLLDVALVAYPDERLGERACAFVVVRKEDPVTLKSLTEYLEQTGIAKAYWPERLEVIGEMPYTMSGKVQKFKLREMLASAAGKGASSSGDQK